MSNFIKPNPTGTDKSIQSMQIFLYPALLAKWLLEDLPKKGYNMHGRAYKNQTEDGLNPEVYIGKKEYKEVFFDDGLKALSFFIEGDSAKYINGSTTIPVSLIYMVKVDKLKPEISQRADEEIRLDVQNLCASDRYGFKLVGFDTGIDICFKEFSGFRKTYGIKYKDIQPLHCFRINFILLYDAINNINC